ncbi:rhomboid family intramembrane serine protease [Thermosediminibacter litoriperuensis]|uniref:Membrane associated rhomboid family serine protease n=1 Tax=Thermosediminibacter litoriperuensis TaxID=291989 RepID=A0A5S5AV22_9FIRM|nr:rhomboid family intramembrane serine protease [Thermosediminibacter litoriperuensis]TYP56139.1 membrane associated rhomboid family serine protease [Thermosediminibacter litoriperuensis]
MFPIRDNIPSRRPPLITVLLIIINSLIFFTLSGTSYRAFVRFTYKYGLIPAKIMKLVVSGAPFSSGDLYPFITSIFLHGSTLHLISNMWILWLFGDNVEDRMGHIRFLIFYLLSGVIAGVFHIVFNPLSRVPVVGASGAIAGVMGAYFVLFPSARIITLVPTFFLVPIFLQIPAVVYLFLWFLAQLYSGTVYSVIGGAAVSGIAWWAHIGGFVSGVLLNRFFLKRR